MQRVKYEYKYLIINIITMNNPEAGPGGETTESPQAKELSYAMAALNEKNWPEAVHCLDMCISNFPNPDQSGLEKTEID